MPGPWYASGSDPELYDKVLLAAGEYREVECYDDRGKTQGFSIVKLVAPYKPGKGGRFVQAEYVAHSDSYYEW